MKCKAVITYPENIEETYDLMMELARARIELSAAREQIKSLKAVISRIYFEARDITVGQQIKELENKVDDFRVELEKVVP